MLSKTAEYALRAVACMVGQIEQRLSANVLAEQTKVPRRYLTCVLQDLGVTIKDLVESTSPILPLCDGASR